MWSSLTFRQVATSAFSWSVHSSWKLDSSSTYSSTSSPSRSSAGVPRLPPTATRLPAAAAISPTRVVTVLFALEPVMAMIGALALRANNSISPDIFTPRAAACCNAGVARAKPGLTSSSLARQRNATSSSPQRKSTCGNSARKVASSGGLARLSATAKGRPWRARKRTRDMPLLPRPTTMRKWSDAIRLIQSSAQFQGGKADQHQNHGDDPEAHDHARLRPAFQFKVVMDRRHAEHALAGQLEGGDLNHHRQGLHDEHAAHDEQDDFLADDHRNGAQRGAQRQGADVTHKDLCGVGVEPQKAQTGTDQRRAEHDQLARARHIRDQQVFGELHVARQVAEDPQRTADHHGRQNG